MATFTTYAAIRTDIKNAIATHVAGQPMTRSYQIGDFAKTFNSVEELKNFYKMTYELEALDNTGNYQSMVSYGRWNGNFR